MRRAVAIAALAALAGCATPPPPPAPVAAAPPRPHRVAPARVANLINEDGDQVIAALGPPILKRAENGGEVWLYANANGCSLDVVLFPAKGGPPKVSNATTRTPPALSEAACLQSIADEAP